MCGRGVIFNLEGNIIKNYACGLGIGTNNQTECYALFLGLKLSLASGIHSLVVSGDSLLIHSNQILSGNSGLYSWKDT